MVLVGIEMIVRGKPRVDRALASVFLYRSPGVPLPDFADQKDAYLDTLEAADAGESAAFLRFIGQRAADAVDLTRPAGSC